MAINATKPLTQEDADYRHMLDHAFKKAHSIPRSPSVCMNVLRRFAKR